MSINFVESLNIQTSVSFPWNKILIDALGREQRIVPHQSPVREFNFEKKTLTSVEANSLQQVFDAQKGRNNYFFYTDKSDYKATKDARVVGFNTYTQGVVVYTAGSPGSHVLTKRYICGSSAHYRIMGQVRNLTIHDYLNNNAEVTGWSYDHNTGIVYGLPGTQWYHAEFEFDTAVRFADDTVDLLLKTKQFYPLYATNIKLVEQRLPWPQPFNDAFDDFLAQELSIDMLFESTTTRKYSTQVRDLASGFVKATAYQPTAITEVTLGERQALSEDELEYLLCLWLNAKGSGAFWAFRDPSAINNPQGTGQWAAFRDNTLTYTLRSPMPKQYAVSNLTARVFYEGIHYSSMGSGGWDGPILTLCDCVFITV